MPGGDGTGPWWTQGRGWRCWRTFGSGRGFGWRYWQRVPFTEPVSLTKEQQKKILQAELLEIEKEKQEIEKRLKEIES